jgi:hypothetical protein
MDMNFDAAEPAETQDFVPQPANQTGAAPTKGRRTRQTLQSVQLMAEKRGGKCLSDRYEGSQSRLTWQCAKGHQWCTTVTSIIGGSWCPHCCRKAKLTIDKMQETARERGGECLSTVYVNTKTPLRWRCADGHEWEAIPDSVHRAATWCPACAGSHGERLCRSILEDMIGVSLPTKRPIWLVSASGGRLEIDGYNADSRIGFEYQGEQHYKDVGFFTGRSLSEQRIADDLKMALCREHGVRLIVIPTLPPMSDFSINVSLIATAARAAGVAPQDNWTAPADCRNLPNSISGALGPLRDLVKSLHGGECLSTTYLGGKAKLLWRCAKGHEFKANADNTRFGKWCPICSARRAGDIMALGITAMHALAAKNGGECLSTEYVNSKEPLTWRCAMGHVWSVGALHLLHDDSWCPTCSYRNRALALRQKNDKAKTAGKMNDRQRAIIEALRAGPLRRIELAQQIGTIPSALRVNLQSLLRAGLIACGANDDGFSRFAYRLVTTNSQAT